MVLFSLASLSPCIPALWSYKCTIPARNSACEQRNKTSLLIIFREDILLVPQYQSKIESVSALNTEERDSTLNKQRMQTIALQASSEYLMNHIAGVMDMVHDTDDTLDEETL